MNLQLADAAKSKQLRAYFAQHGRIYIVVNATGDDVVVPEHLHGDPALRLVLNVRMPQSIHIRDDALESEFLFSGNAFKCHIPMHAIWAAYVPEQKIENGILWEADVPETIRAVVKAVRSMGENDGQVSDEGRHGTQEPVTDKESGKGKEQARGRRVGHLRVVK